MKDKQALVIRVSRGVERCASLKQLLKCENTCQTNMQLHVHMYTSMTCWAQCAVNPTRSKHEFEAKIDSPRLR